MQPESLARGQRFLFRPDAWPVASYPWLLGRKGNVGWCDDEHFDCEIDWQDGDDYSRRSVALNDLHSLLVCVHWPESSVLVWLDSSDNVASDASTYYRDMDWVSAGNRKRDEIFRRIMGEDI